MGGLPQKSCAAILLLTAVLLLPVAPARALECPDTIRIAFTDSSLPPYVIGTGTEFADPPGKFVTWARNALETLGCTSHAELRRLPYNRILSYMEAGDIDFRVSGGYKPELNEIMVFPLKNGKDNRELAIAENRTALYALRDNGDISWNGKTLLDGGNPGLVGAVRGHFAERLTRTAGLNVETPPHWDANVEMLMKRRVTAIVGPTSVIEAFAEADRMKALNPPLAVNTYYAPSSKIFEDKYPEFTRRFWLEICRESRVWFDKLPTCRLDPGVGSGSSTGQVQGN